MSGFLLALAVGAFILLTVSRLTRLAPQLMAKGLSPQQRHYLTKDSKYYRKLLPTEKLDFERRVASFISAKSFIPRNFAEVTDEMKVLIAATAVQLTFGLRTVSMKHFRYIVVYPQRYFSVESRRYHHGEVNPKSNAIVLSWENFLETMSKDDGRNLGLHEMAHALELENMIRNGEQDFFDRDVLQKWSMEVAREIKRMRVGSTSLFRDYAATDHYEFFASAVELFFERPKDLQVYNRQLYALLCVLLNQDPLLLNR